MTQPGIPGNPEATGPPSAELDVSGSRAGQSVQAGERSAADQAFADFYRGHITRLVAYLVYQGAATHLAADIAQDAMTTAYRRWAEVTSPRAYVWRVAYRAYVRHVLDEPELPVGEVPEPASMLPCPGEAETWLQTQQIIQVLRELPPRQRQVLALTIDGWTPSEIAEMIGIDPAAVRSNLMKARRSADEHRRNIGGEAP